MDDPFLIFAVSSAVLLSYEVNNIMFNECRNKIYFQCRNSKASNVEIMNFFFNIDILVYDTQKMRSVGY